MGFTDIVGIILKWAIPLTLGGIVGALVTQFRAMKKRETAIAIGVQCLLRAELIRCHKEYMEKGFCPIYARESISRMYDAYHNLGGNDVVTTLVTNVLNLPTEAGHAGN